MNNKSRETVFLPFALMIPTIEAAMGTNWILITLLCTGGFLICRVSSRAEYSSRWLRYGRLAAITLILSVILQKAGNIWPGEKTEIVIPLALLILALIAAGKGRAAAQNSANVLRYGVYLVVALLAILAVRSISWKEMMSSKNLPGADLCMLLLLPMLNGDIKQYRQPLYAIPAALLTAGIKTNGLYAFSRNLKVRGMPERMESIAACTVTIGYYAAVVYLLTAMIKEQKTDRVSRLTYVLAGTAVLCMLLKPPIRGELNVILILLLWGIIPLLADLKNKLKKEEKSA